ncbi:hypothetical protein DCS_04415 [Drechmeria coniospora]|uniref:F-box domain-containing protein n=1 Tax=Drechmeria coniospora TaxID=98403 RepID=A0A151GJY9_DRECN|nr:hypothetical protein DCS_04415 [Drechmeria coniospora]KYK57406.1 hypothetical protein DCS_04415 [Drechmeria coniospora]ODA79306.1 hypothetical protein RJ55_04899 [Drechmeria coniospora]
MTTTQNPSVAGHALSIPEILRSVLESADDSTTLLAAIRVNEQWFDCGTDVVWGRRPSLPISALAGVANHRQQLYASKIRQLEFNGDDEIAFHERFRHLHFTNLRAVSLDAYRLRSGSKYYIKQYLQPSLERFSFYGGDLDDELLEYIRTTCWRLSIIQIMAPGPMVTAPAFFRFISGCKCLKNISLHHKMRHLLTDHLLLHLAGRPSLRSLAFDQVCSRQILAQISNDLSAPFKDLQVLHTAASSTAAPLLAQLVGQLTTLVLTVADSDAPVMHTLASLRQLKHLTLSFAADTELSPKDILSLKPLCGLESLRIGPAEGESSVTVSLLESGFADSHFDELCSALPNLRDLFFHVQATLSLAALESLSKHCPSLMNCEMMPVFDTQMQEWEAREDVLFPNLRCLEIGGFESPTMPAKQLAALLRKHCPHMTELYFIAGNQYTDDVDNAYALLLDKEEEDGNDGG